MSMKTSILISALALLFSAGTTFGQEMAESQVPSLIINNFHASFPKAYDVDWEMDGELYKTEFETGLAGTDHDTWYDKAGNLVRHKEEISKSDLPEKVLAKIKSDYTDYRIDDIKRITEGKIAIYTLELKTFTEEWKVVFDNNGNVLNKTPD